MSDAETLARGWHALRNLELHANTSAGIPALDSSVCADCMRYAAALLRGARRSDALHLRCEKTRQWERDVDEASRIADQYSF